MKQVFRSLALLAAFTATFVFSTSAQQAVVGQQAPDFTLTDIDGKTHKLSDYRGKTVVLEWMNQECPFVVKHYQKSGNIPATQKTAIEKHNVVWLTINSGKPGAQGDYSPEKVRAWMKDTKAMPSAYLRDQSGVVGRLYGAKTTPQMYVITPEGKLVYNGAIDSIRSSRVGDIDRAENYVISALNAVKAGKPVATPVSEPYGCSVKY